LGSRTALSQYYRQRARHRQNADKEYGNAHHKRSRYHDVASDGNQGDDNQESCETKLHAYILTFSQSALVFSPLSVAGGQMAPSHIY
jgi:hypothetical protein